jgi:excisionase family DNA binding protein
MTALDSRTVVPQDRDTDALTTLADTLASVSTAEIVVHDGARATIPGDLVELLREAVSNLASGRAVTLTTRDSVLTTQAAANLLGISRPTLVRLLDQHLIPYTQPQTHRRVLLADVLAYRARLRQQQSHALQEMADGAQQDGLTGFVKTR